MDQLFEAKLRRGRRVKEVDLLEEGRKVVSRARDEDEASGARPGSPPCPRVQSSGEGRPDVPETVPRQTQTLVVPQSTEDVVASLNIDYPSSTTGSIRSGSCRYSRRSQFGPRGRHTASGRGAFRRAGEPLGDALARRAALIVSASHNEVPGWVYGAAGGGGLDGCGFQTDTPIGRGGGHPPCRGC